MSKFVEFMGYDILASSVVAVGKLTPKSGTMHYPECPSSGKPLCSADWSVTLLTTAGSINIQIGKLSQSNANRIRDGLMLNLNQDEPTNEDVCEDDLVSECKRLISTHGITAVVDSHNVARSRLPSQSPLDRTVVDLMTKHGRNSVTECIADLWTDEETVIDPPMVVDGVDVRVVGAIHSESELQAMCEEHSAFGIDPAKGPDESAVVCIKDETPTPEVHALTGLDDDSELQREEHERQNRYAKERFERECEDSRRRS